MSAPCTRSILTPLVYLCRGVWGLRWIEGIRIRPQHYSPLTILSPHSTCHFLFIFTPNTMSEYAKRTKATVFFNLYKYYIEILNVCRFIGRAMRGLRSRSLLCLTCIELYCKCIFKKLKCRPHVAVSTHKIHTWQH